MKIFALALFATISPLIAQETFSAAVMEADVQLVIPTVSFKDTTLGEAVDFLTRRSVELDQDPDLSKKGIRFIIIPAAGPDAGSTQSAPGGGLIDYSGTNVTLEVVLRAIASDANQDVYLTSVGIVIAPKGLTAFPNSKAEKGEVIRKIS